MSAGVPVHAKRISGNSIIFVHQPTLVRFFFWRNLMRVPFEFKDYESKAFVHSVYEFVDEVCFVANN